MKVLTDKQVEIINGYVNDICISGTTDIYANRLAAVLDVFMLEADDYMPETVSCKETKTENNLVGKIFDITLTDEYKASCLVVEESENYYTCVTCNTIDNMVMNKNNETEGGWEACEGRKYLNEETIKLFPESVEKDLIPFENGDLLMIPEKSDILGDRRWEPMKLCRNRICPSRNEISTWYWLRDAASAASFVNIDFLGNAGYENASYHGCIRPVFRLKKSFLLKLFGRM